MGGEERYAVTPRDDDDAEAEAGALAPGAGDAEAGEKPEREERVLPPIRSNRVAPFDPANSPTLRGPDGAAAQDPEPGRRARAEARLRAHGRDGP